MSEQEEYKCEICGKKMNPIQAVASFTVNRSIMICHKCFKKRLKEEVQQ